MKKLVLIITLIVTGITVKAQDGPMRIPAEVTSSFNQKFSGINTKEVDWDIQENNYKAEFSMGKKDYDVLFDSTGQWISSEVEDLTFAELPDDVKEGLSKKGYSSDKVRDIEMTESQDETMYKIEVKDGMMKHHDVFLDEEGNIVKEEC